MEVEDKKIDTLLKCFLRQVPSKNKNDGELENALIQLGFTMAEAKSWIDEHPDFHKGIATSLTPKRPPDKLPVYL
jgi:hypothetical protein